MTENHANSPLFRGMKMCCFVVIGPPKGANVDKRKKLFPLDKAYYGINGCGKPTEL